MSKDNDRNYEEEKRAPSKVKSPNKQGYKHLQEHYFRITPAKEGHLYQLEHITMEYQKIISRELSDPDLLALVIDKAERVLISFRDEK